jgi:succinate-acetate transporter protein
VVARCANHDTRAARVFISATTTHLLIVLAKLGVALSSLVRIAGHGAITRAVAAWYVAFAHITDATLGRDLIPTGRWPRDRRGTGAYDEGVA